MSTACTATWKSRPTDAIVLSVEQSEGQGARVRRSIGGHKLRNLDPFLMLDEFKVGLPGGFPDHPHRGFETVTFLLPDSVGTMEHEDFVGHRGLLNPGDLQWMTAGRGVMHSEVPGSSDPAHGLQLWVNLKAKDKMVDPNYQELKYQDVPKAQQNGVFVAVISGSALGVESPVKTLTPTHYLYVRMEPGAVFEHPLADGWTSFMYTLKGDVIAGQDETSVGAHNTVTFAKDTGADGVRFQTKDAGAEFVFVSGEPTGDPIVQHGPFVMNTQEEIAQTFEDFQLGKNGFEGAARWRSQIAKRM